MAAMTTGADHTGGTDGAETAALRSLLRSAPLFDGHNDLLWELREQAGGDFGRLDIARPAPSLQTDLPRLRAGGVGAQFWSVYVPDSLSPEAAAVATFGQIDAAHAMFRRYHDDLEPALTADDVERVVRSGRIASMIGVEGGHCIAGSPAVLRAMHALGARYLTLTHNHNNAWADSATDTPEHGGLTPFGVGIVAELNDLGMLVDLSHVSAATMNAALDATRAPVVFSHSSARALCDHPRNVPDDVLGRLPANGGVCMVTVVPGFVSQPIADVWLADNAEEARLRARFPDRTDLVAEHLAAWRAAHPYPPATVSQVADHVDHVREVAGLDHIGIGGDYDGTPVQTAGLEDVSCYPRLFEELRRRGYADGELRRIAGLNVLRALRGAEREAVGPR
jgi:membrane dipeptidase